MSVFELGQGSLVRLDYATHRGLERVLSTTNVIENLIGTTPDLSARVKRWRDGEMIVRWTATAMREASTKFRRIAGHKDMPKLVHALRAHDMAESEHRARDLRQAALA